MTHGTPSSLGVRQLYGKSNHPYYVVAPDYQRSSAGIRVMHQFCAALRMCGQEAWISTGLTNPSLDTPILTEAIRRQHLDQGLIPVAVYPEVVGRNPLHCHVVTRYILNKPGLLGEKPHYKPTDLLFVYEPELLAETATAPWGVLHLPSIDTSVFHNRNNPHNPRRQGWCVYAGRHVQGLKEHPALLADCTVITRDWPSTREEMAALFRRSEGVYCFENTAISMEARLCGCPVVQLPSHLYNKDCFFGSGLGLAKGISFLADPQAVEAARAELPGLSAGYEALESQFWQGLDQWIQDTQALAAEAATAQPAPLIDDTPPDDPAYRDWYQLNAPGELQAQHLATRWVQRWTDATSVHLLMAVGSEELERLIQTVQSLTAQVFENWMLTVATTESAPVDVQGHARIQWLQAREAAQVTTILHEMAKVSGGQWLGFLPPGTRLDSLSLQALLDAAQDHPSWQLVYGDDDIQTHDGRSHRARFKPAPDLITFGGASLLDGLALMRQSAYATTFPAAMADGAPAYTLALQLLATGHAQAIGHVHGIWAHLPEQADTTVHGDNEREVVVNQLHRIGISADVQTRAAKHLRLINPVSPTQPKAVTVVILGADTLDATLTQWRHMLGMGGTHGLQACLIANRLTSPTEAQLLRTAVLAEQSLLPTSTVDLPGLSEGEALAELCMQITSPLAWIFGPTTVSLQADGLRHLAAWFEWPGVAAVQPALWDMASQQVLSPGFAPGLAWERLALPPETTDNAPTQQRTLACLNGEGVLIQTTELQRSLQQMTAFDLAFWPQALSRQLTLLGKTMVWKPEVVCGTHAPPPVRKATATQMFMSQNLSWLTSNGAYNPRLSLKKPALVDAQRTTPWLDLATDIKRLLLLQEAHTQFPAVHLPALAQLGKSGEASTTLWTVTPSDSVEILVLEIARAGPDVVYFGPHTADGVLAKALALLAQLCPTMRRVCCVAPATSRPAEGEFWQLIDWLHHHLRALRVAHWALVTDEAQAEALRAHHPDVRLVEPVASGQAPHGHYVL